MKYVGLRKFINENVNLKQFSQIIYFGRMPMSAFIRSTQHKLRNLAKNTQ